MSDSLVPSLAQTYAAVDLGSNSFHMVVADVSHGTFRIIDRIRESVRLAAGLNADGQIEAETKARALDCLSRFGQRIRDLPVTHVRVVGTSTLRKVSHKNSDFLCEAEAALGRTINVISGTEEARLIYNGVRGDFGREGRHLVIDIGGSSTELIVAHDGVTQFLQSVPLGCVVLTRQFANRDGEFDTLSLRRLTLHIASVLEPYVERLRAIGFDQVIGASGSIRAVNKVVIAEKWSRDGISSESLERLTSELAQQSHPQQLALNGLSSERKAVIHAGAFILQGVFSAWSIARARVSGSALREGVLLEMLSRDGSLGPATDVRRTEVERMAQQYGVDRHFAQAIAQTCNTLADNLTGWRLSDEDREMLQWSAQLHEIGLSVSHAKPHKHGRYLLQHSDIAGFARAEQLELATLVDTHRGSIQPKDLEQLPRRRLEAVKRMMVLLRLAKLFNRSRVHSNVPVVTMSADDEKVSITLPAGWLEQRPLTLMDLEKEAEQLDRFGFALKWQ